MSYNIKVMSKPAYPLLNTFSYYSFLEGLLSPEDLVAASQSLDIQALALTDHNHLSGVVEFILACQTADMQPLLGLSLDFIATKAEPEAVCRLALLATSFKGWGNLCHLSSMLLDQTPPLKGLTIASFANHSKDLICLTGGQQGPIDLLLKQGDWARAGEILMTLKQTFPDQLYVQLDVRSPNDLERAESLRELAQQHDLPVVAANPVLTRTTADAGLLRLVNAIRLNTQLDDPVLESLPFDAVLPDSQEFAARYAAFPEALENTFEVAERCRFDMPLSQVRFPQLTLPNGQTANEVLRQQAYAGAKQNYAEITAEVTTRLDYELEVIAKQGYAPLFLVMADVLAHAREIDVPTGSRGSAASSLVAHCLGITEPDPLALNLYFERFLNPARAKPPDIDVDIDSKHRDLVLQYVFDRYGKDRVAMVSTVSRFRGRSALREVAKARGIPKAQINRMVKELPWYHRSGRSRAEDPYAELRPQWPQYTEIFDQARQLLGIPRHLSIHPGGVVIAPDTLHELVPTERASKGVRITQFDLESIEPVGLVKLDLLGIRGLAVLADVADFVVQKYPERFASRLDFLDTIPWEDAQTSDLIRNAETIGCFQIESPGMRQTLSDIQASKVVDIMIALALYRPGPLTGGMRDSFVRRHLGQEPVEYLHPALKPLLEDTLGVILYQEDVLRIASGIADFTPAESDLLRRAMSHFDPGKAMQALQKKFVAAAKRKHNIPDSLGIRIWELMYAFAGYGFPKAHAASYARTAWRSAYCKVHYPAEFMAAVLANWGGYYRQKHYIEEARRMGLVVCAPHINYSAAEFSAIRIDNNVELYMGLNQVKELTTNVQKQIFEQRPFRSLADLMVRVTPSEREAENLIKVGALAGLGETGELLAELVSGQWRSGQPALFQMESAGQGTTTWASEDQAAAEKELLGTQLTQIN
ncbi:MAG: DNA polymerase III subunit alpha [Anaerolineales bacterium]|nr:DNA polymerase III subunit alpha [Anaerolineales bacterium]